MKMSNEKCIKLFELVIENNGRPSWKILNKYFSNEESMEIVRQLNLANFAVFTDLQLVSMAKNVLKKVKITT